MDIGQLNELTVTQNLGITLFRVSFSDFSQGGFFPSHASNQSTSLEFWSSPQ